MSLSLLIVSKGFYLSYYLFFLSALLPLSMDDGLKKLREKYFNETGLSRTIFQTICFLLTNFCASYFGLAFAVLELRSIWRFWVGTYFAGHVVSLILGFLLSFLPGKKKPSSTKSEKSKADGVKDPNTKSKKVD